MSLRKQINTGFGTNKFHVVRVGRFPVPVPVNSYVFRPQRVSSSTVRKLVRFLFRHKLCLPDLLSSFFSLDLLPSRSGNERVRRVHLSVRFTLTYETLLDLFVSKVDRKLASADCRP